MVWQLKRYHKKSEEDRLRISWMNMWTKFFENLDKLIKRFQYPSSWVMDVGHDLGVPIPKGVSFEELITCLRSGSFRPSSLYLSMPRKMAEKSFKHPIKKEIYKSCTFFSYYFNRGWLVFALHFNKEQCLSRIYVTCPAYCSSRGFSIKLDD